HHFTQFDFDGDKITVTPIDIKGTVFDGYVLTKEPTPPEEFCAYEIEELRKFLRLALAGAPTVALSANGPTTIDTRLQVPNRFQVPVSGRLTWQSVPEWKLKQKQVPFKLQPGQALEIPLQAQVSSKPFPQTPSLTITFDPGKFRNRMIEVSPYKLAGP